MTGTVLNDTGGLPPDVQELLRRYMPNYQADNVVSLGSSDHMRLIFLGPPDADGNPVPRCAVDLSYDTAKGLADSIQAVASRVPPTQR